MKDRDFFDISCCAGTSDCDLFVSVWNQGIDSHLQAFTRSKNRWEDGRLCLDIHRDELPILLRRLRELETEDADMWADDIETIAKEKYDHDHA